MAAIGGLGDQSAFGTRSSTFLSKITYLIGAAFIVATIFLFKLSIPTRSLETMVTQEIPAAQHTHEHPAHEGECEHDESSKTGQECSYHHAAMKEETSQGQSMGMNPVEKEKQTSSVEEMPATGAQKETGK
ncbi:MAG: preprotein translocase subunit SecG [Planctomycetes bacterium]|nr:preprotein translocase subunit SecG [Planctomycetota bacterium]